MARQAKPKDGWGAYIKQMSAINGQVAFPEIKVKRKRNERAKETQPRRKEEAIFRTNLISFLRRKGCKVFRIEPAFRGKFGLGDLWVSCRKTKWAGWVETKSLTGVLSDDQREFKEDCGICNINHIVARKLDDVLVILNG